MWLSSRGIRWLLFFALLLTAKVVANDDEEGGALGSISGLFTVVIGALSVVLPEEFGFANMGGKKRKRGGNPGSEHRSHTRKYVHDIFQEMGPIYVRRAYISNG